MINEVTFHSWLVKTQPQISKPAKRVNKLRWLSVEIEKEKNIEIDLYSVDSLSLIKEIKAIYFNNTINREEHTRGFMMHKRTFELYEKFLNETYNNESIPDDIIGIAENDNLSPTERKTYSLGRIGQGQYRSNLVQYWGKCAVTGFSEIPLLIASHIKPWRHSNDQEKLDVYNGLLLTPNLDKVFDIGLITFNDLGKIVISEFLEQPRILGIDTSMKIELDKRHTPYLKYHREKIFKTNKTIYNNGYSS